MTCKICSYENHKVFDAKIINKYNVSYYYCNNCNYLQIEDPYWLEEAYREAIHISDTGFISRNIYLSKQAANIIFCLYNKHGKFIDYGGGYGILTRLMRDLGFDYYWFDLYAKNIFARGFEYNTGIGKIELITSFESFEHFANPIEEIDKMIVISKNILFSTELLPTPLPLPENWWYYGLNHGQHVSFYSINTLKYIAKKYHLQLYTEGSLHLLTEKPINLLCYKLILKMGRFGLCKFVSRNMKSKIIDDMQSIKERCI